MDRDVDRHSIKKEAIAEYASELGVSLVGFAPAGRWRERSEISPEFFPDSIWPETKTVIALSIPSLLPVVETKISSLYRSQYNIMNSHLDETAYRLALFLNKQGAASIPVCRDGYGEQKMLRTNPTAAFSHVWAAYYAGLGTIGRNQTLLTRKYGPRHRLTSVFTTASLPGDPVMDKDLCTQCGICARACPVGAFGTPSDVNARMDKIACAKQTFDGPYNHCGFCIKTCPIGEDRSMFKGAKTRAYFDAHGDIEKWDMGVGAAFRFDSGESFD